MANKFQKSVLERLELEKKKSRQMTRQSAMDIEIIPVEDEEMRYTTYGIQVFPSEDGKLTGMDSILNSPKMMREMEDAANLSALDQVNIPQLEIHRKQAKTDSRDTEGDPPSEAPSPKGATHHKKETTMPSPEPPGPLEGYLRLTPTRQAKNKTFYLDLDVIEAVKAAAKHAGVADSKLVNDILRTVLSL